MEKRLFNDPEDIVSQMMEGSLMMNPKLRSIPHLGVLYRADAQTPEALARVALISGGGSGHEPAHAGYIGKGMLSAAVLGRVFASPSIDQIVAAIRVVAGDKGVLLIVKNYTGDRLNFSIAAERARMEGHRVELVMVADDIATGIPGKLQRGPQGRGLAGTIFVHKIAGAAAEEGKSLDEILEILKRVIPSLATLGIATSGCHHPQGGESFSLDSGEVELGLGIHGEAGVTRLKLKSQVENKKVADELVDMVLNPLVQSLSSEEVRDGSFALMINNLGTTTPMEMAIVARRCRTYFQVEGNSKLKIERVICGSIMTALDMSGFSLTFLPLFGEISKYLDAPTEAPAWPRIFPQDVDNFPKISQEFSAENMEKPPSHLTLSWNSQLEQEIFLKILRQVSETAVAQVENFNAMDQVVGDGDLGNSLKSGGKAILQVLDDGKFPGNSAGPSAQLQILAGILQRSLGGSSGPLYSIFFLKMSSRLQELSDTFKLNPKKAWAEAFLAGINGISQLGNSQVGDRTMLDALFPIQQTLHENSTSWLNNSIEAGRRGSESTAKMLPKKGRSVYLGDRVLGHRDAGAEAVVILWESLCRVLE